MRYWYEIFLVIPEPTTDKTISRSQFFLYTLIGCKDKEQEREWHLLLSAKPSTPYGMWCYTFPFGYLPIVMYYLTSHSDKMKIFTSLIPRKTTTIAASYMNCRSNMVRKGKSKISSWDIISNLCWQDKKETLSI